MKRFLFIFFILTSFTVPVSAGIKDSVRFDESKVELRVPDNSTIEKYKADKKFNYKRDKKTDTSWWTRFWRWLSRLLRIDYIKGQNRIWFWIIIILMAVGVLYFIFKNEVRTFFARGNRSTQSLKTEFIDLEMDAVTIESLLQKAIAEKNYAETVRLYYTLTLKNLDEAGAIKFRIDKTNNSYMYELPAEGVRKPFRQLTFYFDYIFYGKFEATENIYLKMKENYNVLLGEIKRIPAR